MPDIFINIGEFQYNKNSSKAAAKYAEAAKTAMRKGILKAVKNAAGFTTEKTAKTTSGYTIILRVSEIIPGTNTVTCKLTGELVTWPGAPKPEMISTSLTGNGKAIADTSDAAVADTIESIAESMVKDRILPVLRKRG
jgi:hypothetical protein